MVLKLICAISFIDILNLGALIPVLHKHVLNIGGTNITHGLLGTTVALIHFISGPIIGNLSDTRGRSYILFLLLIVTLTSHVLLKFSSALTFYAISRLIAGFAGSTQILLKTILTDSLPKEKQTGALGKLGAISAVGFIIGPIIGGYFYQQTKDFSIIYLILSVGTCISIGLLKSIPEIKSNTKSTNKHNNVAAEIIGSFTKLAKVNWNLFWDIFAIKFLLELAYSQFYGTFGIIMTEVFQMNQMQIGYIISFYGSLFIFSNLSLSKFNQYLPKDFESKIFTNVVILAITLFGSFMSTNIYAYVLLFIPLALTKSLFDTVLLATLTERVSETEKGITVGSYESTMALAGLTTPLFMGTINEYYGYNIGRTICLLPTITATILSFYLRKNPIVKLRKD